MDESLYGDYGDSWDDQRFREYLLGHIGPSSVVLDYGAGRGYVEQMNFRGIAKHVAGVDPDRAVRENPHLDEARILSLPDYRLPFAAETFDLVFSDNVMEHVTDPMSVLLEIRRVLRRGGRFVAKTPNRWHYMAMIASISPLWFHRFYNSLRGRSFEDTFPTVYRCNTAHRVGDLARNAGFSVSRVERWEGRPEYLRIFAPTYTVGFLYERLVNSTELLAALRCVLMFDLRKIDPPLPG